MPGVTMPLGEAVCTRCEVGFDPSEQIVNSAGELWHPDCFVCAQCFQPFPDGVFYEFEGRKYCEHDFQVLFAPCCQQCNEFIIGRVIKAMNASWHPACFRCNMCSKELADLGFIKNGNQALCHDCNARIRLQGTGRYMCHKCHAVVDGEPLRFRGELYHPYHFNCKACGIELDSRAREVKSRAGYTSCRAERAVLSALPRQDGHPDMWRVPPAHRGASGHRARQELARGAFRVRQVREALPGPPPLREEGSGVLPHRLPPALRKHLLCVQLRRRGRSGALAEQGLVPASLRLQRLRSAAHAQVQVLRDGHETGVQEVLREAAARAAPPPQAAARERGSRHGFRRVHGGRVALLQREISTVE
ncbi:LIM and senescent cell antigen-like-containing domain protein 1 isoform X5 [Pollicipes pollicipes]|uniref:LIM and senescent cell antigen-like-containing domain protein 1 isoform X5 n=1 Tax=Pollicipes pollicipes TaxID=41117 RepID=UPI0018855015|nr:LIM and senescent cell antigen-like-containing domain protein 1 isoform X5 [Pollicipes pollicipes]